MSDFFCKKLFLLKKNFLTYKTYVQIHTYDILILKKIFGYYLIQFFFTIYFKLKTNKEKMCNYALKIVKLC